MSSTVAPILKSSYVRWFLFALLLLVSTLVVLTRWESSTWDEIWVVGLLPYFAIVVLATWRLWWSSGPSVSNRDASAALRTVYLSDARATLSYALGLLAFYYATYVLVSLGADQIKGSVSMFHLVFWSLGPPFWFFFEWFIWFDNHQSDGAAQKLRIAQDLFGKFWAAVLAVMLTFKLGDIVKLNIH